MNSKQIKNKKFREDLIKKINHAVDCKVSKASNEIMLDRVCNGKGIDFPFS